MWHCEPPLRDMRYVIEGLLGLPAFVVAGRLALA